MRVPALALVVMVLTVGCQTDRVEPDSPAPDSARETSEQGRSAEESGSANLPPPGNPVVGGKPSMPEPVLKARLDDYTVEDFATGLEVPWDMAFTPDGRVYVTERPGRVRLIENGQLRDRPYHTLSNVYARGEGGLMGIVLHPEYPDPRWVYVMYTYRAEGNTYNRVSRFTDTGASLADEKPVVVRIPGAFVHNGGIIRFGPDGMLYIGTGDAGESESAQNLDSLGGKILRVTPEGNVPSDNPFPNSRVYSYGFRNVQGLAWNPSNGDLWATNHGPTGEFGLSAMDSIYIVRRGGNHGWPRVLGVSDIEGVVDPVLFYKNVAVPPALATFYDGDLMPDLRGNLFFASLRGEHLERVVVSGSSSVNRIERWFATGTHEGRYGRLRAIAQGRDGALYVSTSNRDGRGNARPGDDRIIRISAQ